MDANGEELEINLPNFNIPSKFFYKYFSFTNSENLPTSTWPPTRRLSEGNRSKVTVKKLTASIITDNRFIMLRIFEIERCWAYSRQLKDESANDSRKKFHSRNRLRKGVKLADELSEIMKELPRLESSTLLELKAYISWIKGQFFFDKEEWIIAKELLENAKKIYNGLSESLKGDSREIYKTKCNEIDPQIRYCAYNSGDQNSANYIKKVKDVDNNEYLDSLLKSCSKEDVEKITQISWFEKVIPVKNEQVKMFILSLKNYESELSKIPEDDFTKRISIYESNILKGCSEAISALKEEIKTLENSINSAVANATGDLNSATAASNIPNSGDKTSKMNLLLNYLLWSKSKFVIARNLLQIKSALKPSGNDIVASNIGLTGFNPQLKPNELARLYDSVVQSLGDVSLISGPPKDNEIVADILKVKQLAYRCYRCYYLALAHANNKSFVQCLGLLKRSRENIVEFSVQHKNLSATQIDETIPGDSFEILKNSLEKLDSRCQAEELTCKAQRILQLSSDSTENSPEDNLEEGSHQDKRPLIERSKEFFTEKQIERTLLSQYNSLVDVVPDFEPVPMKPIFFDLALNYIDYPTMPAKNSKNTTDNTESSNKGLTGMVKGWLWGS